MGKNVSNSLSVSAISVIDLANELLERNDIDKDYVSQLGEDFQRLYASWRQNESLHNERLPEQLLVKLWNEAKAFNADPLVGLEIGAKVNHSAKGLLANWVFQCHSLSESFEIFSQNIHLLNPSETWQRVDQDKGVKLVFSFNNKDYPDIAVDRSMATIVSWSSALSGKSIRPIKTRLVRSEPASSAAYQRVFGDDILFEQSENSLLFAKDDFHQPNEFSNPYLKALVKEQAEELEAALDRINKQSAKVFKLLQLDLPYFCQIERVCEALHMSRSTLFRKLKAENTSFTALLKDTRIAKAKHLDKQKHNHSDIAHQLGFQDLGSYYRFRKDNAL